MGRVIDDLVLDSLREFLELWEEESLEWSFGTLVGHTHQ